MRIGILISCSCVFMAIHSGCSFFRPQTSVMKYTYSADAVEIQSGHDDFQLSVCFRKNGVNQLMAIDQIRLAGPRGVSETRACTDWVGPYMVKDATVKQAKEPGTRFTGGWHGSNGDGTGTPTAETVRYTLTADGSVLREAQSGAAEKITLTVTNRIKSYDTAEFVLEERVAYTLRANKIDVHVRIIALKDAAISRYYGLQTQNGEWNREIRYIYKTGDPVVAPLTDASFSDACAELSDLIGFELSSTKHPYTLYAWMNHDNPLTTFEFVSPTNACAFTAGYGKSYFNLVNGKVLHLKKGQSVEWSGGYVFTVVSRQEGDEIIKFSTCSLRDSME